MSGYEFDVFISYSRRGSAQKWLLNHFYPRLQERLADEIAPAPRVFVDKGMERGVDWPYQLEKALHRSKILVAVLSPPYFTSAWCMAELSNMLAREKFLGLASPDRPQGLIYPILYADSINFPDIAELKRSWWDFKGLAIPDMIFQESRDWIPFYRKLTEFAQDLVELLKQVPEWQPDWPAVVRPTPVLLPTPPIPRFGP
ncbi:MAG TPA: toll/interleukin-1 receptor domain-containing protein [Pseudonocardiaceae bacterium]|nr:toll/interleukin-1 receptor domain-containing protein [Pseudonocardiaceae bacterium]